MLKRQLIVLTFAYLAAQSVMSAAQLSQEPNDAHRDFELYLTPAGVKRVRLARSEKAMTCFIGPFQLGALSNRWHLGENSPLAQYFEKLGVTTPHDIDGIVAETYGCKIHGRPFALHAKIAKVRKYYARKEAMRPKERSPLDGAEIDWVLIFESSVGELYLGVSRSDGSFWRFDYRNGRGIEPARLEEAKDLAEHIKR